MKALKLYTIQSLNILNQLALGRYVCDAKKSGFIQEWGFKDAYDWMVEQMISRVGVPPEKIEYPVWAFADIDNPNWMSGGFGVPGDVMIRVDVEIDESRVVMSDFDGWHSVLNDYPFFDTYEEYDSFEEMDSECQEKVKLDSWQRIFREHSDEGCQITFWELRLEDVIGVTLFVVPEQEEHFGEEECK
ncbi:DUF3841 domain-containing protein [Candidatus Saccharibacteria bacterium]|nr:DUF3841 domain-containing protein [Candidatus Saccharibacteria bacterium]